MLVGLLFFSGWLYDLKYKNSIDWIGCFFFGMFLFLFLKWIYNWVFKEGNMELREGLLLKCVIWNILKLVKFL